MESLLRRATNYALAALRLTGHGFYHEALGLTRGIGEIVDLFRLFRIDDRSLARWKSLTDRQQRQEFGPVSVRQAIRGPERILGYASLG